MTEDWGGLGGYLGETAPPLPFALIRVFKVGFQKWGTQGSHSLFFPWPCRKGTAKDNSLVQGLRDSRNKHPA